MFALTVISKTFCLKKKISNFTKVTIETKAKRAKNACSTAKNFGLNCVVN